MEKDNKGTVLTSLDGSADAIRFQELSIDDNENAVAVYPCKPQLQPASSDPVDSTLKESLDRIALQIPRSVALPPPHPIWTQPGSNLKYTSANKWQSIPSDKREACRRERIHGVEVRTLGPDHFLGRLAPGQCGLFASQRFQRFDVIGEYTGKIVGSETCGHYVACLEDKGNDESLGIDGEVFGSEMRFINSYLNIAFKPNTTMRTAYINTYPHIVIVCTEDIEIGEEILLDYGEGYTKAFLTPKAKVGGYLSQERIRHALPGYGSDGSRSSSDSEQDDNNSNNDNNNRNRNSSSNNNDDTNNRNNNSNNGNNSNNISSNSNNDSSNSVQVGDD